MNLVARRATRCIGTSRWEPLVREPTLPARRRGRAPSVPDTSSLAKLAEASRRVTDARLAAGDADRVRRGPSHRRLLLVGEQPGDQEDRRGHPFVGPAGRVLWQCLADAGLTADDVYVTNAVKHFKHEVRGARRLHKKPTAAEVDACHPWLEAELRAVRAKAVVALGATAARSLLGRNVPIAASRDRRFEVAGLPALVTYHPSAVLRADERAAEIRRALVDDLLRAGELAAIVVRSPTCQPEGLTCGGPPPSPSARISGAWARIRILQPRPVGSCRSRSWSSIARTPRPSRGRSYQRELHDLQVELVKLQKWVVEQGERDRDRVRRPRCGRQGRGDPPVLRVLEPPPGADRLAPQAERHRAHAVVLPALRLPPPRGRRDRPVRPVLVQPRRRGARDGVLHPRRVRRVLPPGPSFERNLVRSGITLFKLWFAVSRDEQRQRFHDRKTDPLRQWKLSPMDIEALGRFDEYSQARDEMLRRTDHEVPWTVVNSNDKRRARLGAIRHVLGAVPYHHRRDDVVGTPDAHVVVPATLGHAPRAELIVAVG